MAGSTDHPGNPGLVAFRQLTRDNLTEMATFGDIKAGARLRELDAAGVAEIVQATRFGPDALNFAFRVSGRVGKRLVYRGEEMGQRAEDARALAYRLFEIATQKGWASEALIYNALAQEWPRLAEMAPELIARRETGASQMSLL
jgi:hypothetical protein